MLLLMTPWILTSRQTSDVTSKTIRLLVTYHHTIVIVIRDPFSIASFGFIALRPPRENAYHAYLD